MEAVSGVFHLADDVGTRAKEVIEAARFVAKVRGYVCHATRPGCRCPIHELKTALERYDAAIAKLVDAGTGEKVG